MIRPNRTTRKVSWALIPHRGIFEDGTGTALLSCPQPDAVNRELPRNARIIIVTLTLTQMEARTMLKPSSKSVVVMFLMCLKISSDCLPVGSAPDVEEGVSITQWGKGRVKTTTNNAN